MTEHAAATAKANVSDERTMALVAYILGWVTGLIVLLTSAKGARFQRWHAIQSIGLSIAVIAVYVVLSVILIPLALTGSTALNAIGGLLMFLVYGAAVVLWIMMMVTAYQGKKLRLPIVSNIADMNA